MTDPAYDPLSASRSPEQAWDVALWGNVYLDIIFTGLDAAPQGGTEVQASGMGSCPGGIANLAVATSRLGLRTALSAAFAEDGYADFCWEILAEERVGLETSRRYEQWHSPLTVSYAVGDDRSMVTHAHRPPGYDDNPVPPPPTARAVIVDLGSEEMRRPAGAAWLSSAKDAGSLIFADLGWDSSESWSVDLLAPLDHCYAFLPNASEAMAYTRTETAQDALYALADRVPLAIVTNGAHGALALDASTGEEVSVPSLRVPALDATGAGDVFGAAVVTGTLAEWPLPQRISFGTLCSALAVQQFGGSLAAPGWGDIAQWWHTVRDGVGTTSYDVAVRRRYDYLEDLVATVPEGAVHRAQATIARRADVLRP